MLLQPGSLGEDDAAIRASLLGLLGLGDAPPPEAQIFRLSYGSGAEDEDDEAWDDEED